MQTQKFGCSLASGCCWSCGCSSNPCLPGQHVVGGKQAAGPHRSPCAVQRWRGFVLKMDLPRSRGKVFTQNFQTCAKKIYSLCSPPSFKLIWTQWLWLRAGGDGLSLSSSRHCLSSVAGWLQLSGGLAAGPHHLQTVLGVGVGWGLQGVFLSPL